MTDHDPNALTVVEGVAGYWHYHLRSKDSGPALCGAQVMRTSIPVQRWGKTPANYHIPESWCRRCREIGGLGD